MDGLLSSRAKKYKTREQIIEREANYFARSILIPEHLLNREVERIKKRDKTENFSGLSSDNTIELSELFVVEIAVMTMRLTELDIIG